MDLVTSITGLEVEAVFADLQTVHPIRKRPKGEVQTYTGKTQAPVEHEPVPISTEDYGAVMFRFKGGAKGTLHVSQVTAGRKNCLRYEIAGAKCSLAWNSETPNEMRVGHRTKANESLIRDPSLLSDLARHFATYPGGHNEGFPDAFKGCFRSFYEYIDKGDFSAKPLYPTFADGHHSIVLCDAILKSHREQRWTPVG